MRISITLLCSLFCLACFGQPSLRHQAEFVAGNGEFRIGDVKIDDEGYFVYGCNAYEDIGGSWWPHPCIMKTDRNGNIIWTFRLAYSFNDKTCRIIQAANGDYLVLMKDLFLEVARISRNGALVWFKYYSSPIAGSCASFAGGITELPNGNIAVCSHTDDDITMFNTVWQMEGYVMMLDSAGNITWSKKYGHTQSFVYDTYMFNDIAYYHNKLYVAGAIGNMYNYKSGGMMAVMDTNGNLLDIQMLWSTNSTNGINFSQYGFQDIYIRQGKIILNGIADTTANYNSTYQLIGIMDTGSQIMRTTLLKPASYSSSIANLHVVDTNTFYSFVRPGNTITSTNSFITKLNRRNVLGVKKELGNIHHYEPNTILSDADTVFIFGNYLANGYFSRLSFSLPASQQCNLIDTSILIDSFSASFTPVPTPLFVNNRTMNGYPWYNGNPNCVYMATICGTGVCNQPVTGTVVASGTAVCAGDSVRLVSSGCYDVQWLYNGSQLTGTSDTFYAKTSGIYQAIISANSCTDTTTGVNVVIHPLPQASVYSFNNVLSTDPFATYQWLFNNQLIPGATSQQWTATVSGAYSVIVTDSNGCSDTSAVLPFIPSNVKDHMAEPLSIYPNPAHHDFVLIGHLEQFIKLELATLTGSVRLSASGIPVAGKLSVHIPDEVPPGVYLLRICFANRVATYKLVVDQ